MNKLDILYEDNHIIVVYKPQGVLSQKDITNDLDMLTLVKDYIKVKYHKPGDVYLGLVHRLDRMTSGIMVFARTSKAASRLSEQIKNHMFEKKYLAVVENKLVVKSQRLENKLTKNENLNKSFVSNDGKISILDYNTIACIDGYSLVDIKLLTGRHHQIRVQFSNIGNPLYADDKYGAKMKGDLALQAYSLTFFHPTTKEKLVFTHINENGIFALFKDYFKG